MAIADFLQIPNNYSYHGVIAAFGIAQLVGVRWAMVYNGLDHNAMPRDDLQNAATGKKLKPEHLAMLKRRSAAHYNGLENLAFFVAAVAAVNQARLPVADINAFVVKYVVSRFIYTVLYVFLTNDIVALGRTIVWWYGMLACLKMLVLAGQRL